MLSSSELRSKFPELSKEELDSRTINFNDPEDAFSYAIINRYCPSMLIIKCNNYDATRFKPENSFIEIKNLLPNRYKLKERGWKFHVSLFNVEDNVAKGWNIIKHHLILAQVVHFKVIINSLLNDLDEDPEQRAKAITIYAYKENRSLKQWESLFETITADFVKNKIIPGPFSADTDEYEIKGSNYFSYRYDTGKIRPKRTTQNSYQDFEEKERGEYEDMEIKVANQPNRMTSSIYSFWCCKRNKIRRNDSEFAQSANNQNKFCIIS